MPNRHDEDAQSLSFNPPFTVQGIAFNEFVDEITPLLGRQQTPYYWGFNTDAPLSAVLPVIQNMLRSSKTRLLTADGAVWARLDVYQRGTWLPVVDHAAHKGKPATLPERVLIVETHEGGGTRVMCGLQAAPLPASELKRLRPDL